LNRLAGYDAAIVTEIPGTTRDPLREHLSLDGLPVTVVDTAGLRETNDPVEREGVRRARLEVARADRLLWVADVREPRGATLAAAGAAQGGNGEVTIVANKIDLTDLPPQVRTEKGTTIVQLSALTGAGIDLLVAHLKRAAGVVGEASGTFSARRRHVEALERTRAELGAARAFLTDALEISAEHLRNAQTALSELTGELSSDDLLGEIFATFCIGK
jgi:tRNA modification GTPase